MKNNSKKTLLKKRTISVFSIVILCLSIDAQYFSKVVNEITTDNGNSRSVNWIDYDNDNDLDVYISNGVNPAINAFLYENTGNGNFVKHTEAAVAKNNTRADGSSWADYNNDGNLELYVVAWYGDRSYLYNNLGNGNFEFETEGVLGKASNYSESCSWGDYDNDGFVDLYVANSGVSGKVANYLYHNECGKSFTRILTGSHVTDKFTSRTVNWVDYDNDGDLDLFVSNETGEPNNLYKNLLVEKGKAEFENVVNDPVVQDINKSISSCWGDYDNDGDLDLFIANDGQKNELFQNNGDGTFTKIIDGIQSNYASCSYGCNWADFDNDGDLDLFVTYGWCGVNQNNIIYKNLLIEAGSATFEKVNDTVVTNDGGWSYGSSWGDYDDDGDLDLLVAKCFGDGINNIHNALFRNDMGNLKNWITIKCVGKITNTSAIGAKLLLKAVINDKPVWQMREVSAQESYCSENLYQHFGLGNATSIDSIIVKWPSGIIQYLIKVDTNQFLTIVEDTLLYSGIKPKCEIYTEIENMNNDISNNLFEINPNPSIGTTTISYKIKTPGFVNIGIFDLTGKEVSRVTNEYQQIGSFKVQFDLKSLPGNLYLIQLNSAGFSETKKLLVMKM
jgi:enediyne biosynthesis protein E4